ncbi:MAG TPA: cytochrome c family protein [Sphingomicrobium sp.]|nr:cytochrome c family protein [Sphingomicrobium sp.]
MIALGSSIVTGEVFRAERPETMGYPIEGVEIKGAKGEAEKPIAFYLASADAAKGEQVFKKCAACHNAEPGGPNALGPALYGVMGNPVAAHPGFAYSDALKSKGGTWDWEMMSAWLTSPKKFAPGTKMTFAGLGNPQDRANVMAFLNSRDNAPLPVPAAPAQAAATAEDGAQKAPSEPVLTEQQAAKGGEKNVGGSGAPKVTGPSGADKN